MSDEQKIEWYGDLDDDCSARWRGLILRAEDMGGGWWWDVVLDKRVHPESSGDEIDSCWEHGGLVKDGPTARTAATAAALRYIESKK
jgi:hypothetical protein